MKYILTRHDPLKGERVFWTGAGWGPERDAALYATSHIAEAASRRAEVPDDGSFIRIDGLIEKPEPMYGSLGRDAR